MAEAKTAAVPKLIQSGTGDIYAYTDFLAARGDMHPYDEELFGAAKDGKSPFLAKKAEEEKAEKEAKEAAAKEAAEDKAAKKGRE